MPLAVQRSFDDLGTPLAETTFVVFDLETTGGSPEASRVTEIGAVKVRGGEVLGEFASLVHPGVGIPTPIALLTGITDEMVADAPPIASLLPAFLEFVGDATLVAHNASFDTRFLYANLARHDYPAIANPVVCTVRLARRLVRDEVPNLRLATLAHRLRARTQPSHRALADARATTDVFHALLELAGRYGVAHLDDLLWFQRAAGHPSANKLRLTDALPHARGVYLFRGADGRVLYVGKAADLRARVRSYFGTDDRRRIGDLLRELASIDHLVCATDLEAAVVEARLIRAHAPPFNRAQRGRASQRFLRLTADAFPRLAVATKPAPGALGPIAAAAAATLREALEEAADVRTCTQRIRRGGGGSVCVRGQIGRCPAPCDARIDPASYRVTIAPVAEALAGDPRLALDALGRRMEALASSERFEEAAATRERLAALVEAVRAARATASLTRAGRVVLDVAGERIEIVSGRLEQAGGHSLPVAPDGHPDEPRLIAAWLARNARRARLVSCDGELTLPVGAGRELAAWSARLRALRTVARDPAARASRRTRTP